MKIVLGVVSFVAWCGAMYGYVLFVKELRASGHSFWTWNIRARFDAWRGKPIAIFLTSGAVFLAAIWASFKFL